MYEKKLKLSYLKGFYEELRTIDEAMELFSLNSSELSKKDDYFLYTLVFNYGEEKVKKVIKIEPKNDINNNSDYNIIYENSKNFNFENKNKLKTDKINFKY